MSYGRAAVIGGSIAGTLAARALTEHFDEVIVVDRDSLPTSPGPRRGAPQSNHFHGVMSRGLQLFEDFFPGFIAEATGRGAILTSRTEDVMARRRAGWATREPCDIKGLLTSRELLEWLIRERVRALPSVEYRADARVTGLIEQGGVVTGVRGDTPSQPGQTWELTADLVVDASGRSSAADKWLIQNRREAPREVVVDANYAYSSCFVRVPEGFDPGFKVFSALPRPNFDGAAKTRGASFMAQDGENRWILTVVGCAGDHPPADEAGFREFIDSLGYPELDKALESVELMLPIRGWKVTANRWRRYDEVEAMPENFVLVGDAVAAFNPVYGQGMTAAALAANELRSELAIQSRDMDSLEGFAKRFQRSLVESSERCWGSSTGGDYLVQGVKYTDPPVVNPERNAYMDRLEALSAEDTDIYVRFVETVELMRTGDWVNEATLRARVIENWDRLGEVVQAEPCPAPRA